MFAAFSTLAVVVVCVRLSVVVCAGPFVLSVFLVAFDNIAVVARLVLDPWHH